MLRIAAHGLPVAAWGDSDALVAAAMAKRPQGTPVSRQPPAAKPAAESADAGGGLGGFTAFGGGDFNFTKLLDDLPGGDETTPSDPAAGG